MSERARNVEPRSEGVAARVCRVRMLVLRLCLYVHAYMLDKAETKIAYLPMHIHSHLAVKDEVCYCTKKLDLLKDGKTWMESVSGTVLELRPLMTLHHLLIKLDFGLLFSKSVTFPHKILPSGHLRICN